MAFKVGFIDFKLVVMLGGLRIEMVMLSCIGDWLEDSGWTIALASSAVTTAGNDLLLKRHKVAKTKYAHRVTAMALRISDQMGSDRIDCGWRQLAKAVSDFEDSTILKKNEHTVYNHHGNGHGHSIDMLISYLMK